MMDSGNGLSPRGEDCWPSGATALIDAIYSVTIHIAKGTACRVGICAILAIGILENRFRKPGPGPSPKSVCSDTIGGRPCSSSAPAAPENGAGIQASAFWKN